MDNSKKDTDERRKEKRKERIEKDFEEYIKKLRSNRKKRKSELAPASEIKRIIDKKLQKTINNNTKNYQKLRPLAQGCPESAHTRGVTQRRECARRRCFLCFLNTLL